MRFKQDTFGMFICVTAVIGFIVGFGGVVFLALSAAAHPRNADAPKISPPPATWVSEKPSVSTSETIE